MYQALYREYRPISFDDLLGQDHIVKILKNQVKNKNIGHAYLFSGTRGTGKTTAAKIFSRAVNCIEPLDGNPCNKCSNCIEILEDSSIDVVEMDAASNNSVDDIRELRDKVVYPPSNIKYKVYIIDEVHMLSKGAFNALLKTLEEPPKHLIFILATTEPERLPQTILSRCQRFDFKRIGNRDIILNMENIIEDLNITVEEDVLKLIARNSDGAMRDALSLLDQCISFDEEKITYNMATEILGITNIDLIFSIVDSIIDSDTESSLLKLDGLINDGKDLNQFTKDLTRHYRDLMIVKSAKNNDSLIELENLDRLKEQSDRIELFDIINTIEILTEVENKMKWSDQGRIILEMGLVKIIKLKDKYSLEERLKKIENSIKLGTVNINSESNNFNNKKSVKENLKSKDKIEKKDKNLKVNNLRKKKDIKSYIDNNQDLNIDIINSNWSKVLNLIKNRDIKVYALLKEGNLIEFTNNILTIGYGDKFGVHKEAISSAGNKEIVESVSSEYFRKSIKINFIMSKKKVNYNKNEEETKKNRAIRNVYDVFPKEIIKLK